VNLAATLVPPSLDDKQALRLRRFGVASLSYVLAVGLVSTAWLFGVIPAAAVLDAGAAFIAINAVLYGAIRTGFNLRFEDPSLTRAQILSAITVLMYIVYHMDAGRSVALFGCFIVFQFGVFRLRAREFVGITLYTLAAYALVIDLLMQFRPQAIQDVPGEWMSWLGLAGFLPCMNIIGGQLNTLRRRMRESEARFRSLTEMSSDFYWESDAGHRITQRSSADIRIGADSVFRQGAQIGDRRWDVPYMSPDESGWRAHREVLDAHQSFRDFDFSRLAVDGTERHISISGDPVFDAFGKFSGYRGVGRDTTGRKQAEQALRASEQQLRLFADNVPVMTAYWDENYVCRFASKAFVAAYDQRGDGVVGKHAREIFGEEIFLDSESYAEQVKQGHPASFQRKRTLRNGDVRHFEMRLVPDFGEHDRVVGCFAVTIDITEHKLTEERIQRVANHDNLTGLPNRLLFNDRLIQAISLAKRDSRQFALLYLDLDRFKPVNDALGHAAGDELLKKVAGRIRGQVRESDTVARVGGDEFTIILTDVGRREEAEIVAGKISVALARPFDLGHRKKNIDIGASIGIAIYPADGRDADALVRAADAAMYGAKHAA
jgi:diguanylate cyclase (GGDEF)-like protein/PAS domain S-box-containing protein